MVAAAGPSNSTTAMAAPKQEESLLPAHLPVFHPQDFLRQHQHLPLVLIRRQLHQRLDQYKNALVELINQDYADFVHLSTDLRSVSSLLQKDSPAGETGIIKVSGDGDAARAGMDLEPPMQTLKLVESRFTQYANRLEEALRERQHLRQKKQLLQLFIKMNDAVQKVETLVAELQQEQQLQQQEEEGKEPNREPVVDGQLKLLERLAIELHQLYFLLQKEKNLAFAMAMTMRVDQASTTVEEVLATRMRQSLMDRNISLFSACLRVYSIMGKIAAAEELFAVTLVRPALDRMMKGVSVESTASLRQLFSKLKEFAGKEMRQYWEASRSIHQLPLYSNCIVAEMLSRLVYSFPTMFSPGIPDRFHETYLMSMDLVEYLLKMAGLMEEERLMCRNHTAFQEFVQKWPVTVYYQIRFNELAAVAEAGFVKEWQLEDAVKCMKDKRLALPASTALLKVMQDMWSDRIFLRPIVGRIWRFTLQCLLRYSQWIASHWKATVDVNVGPEDTAPSGDVVLQQTLVFMTEVGRMESESKAFLVAKAFPRMQKAIEAGSSMLSAAGTSPSAETASEFSRTPYMLALEEVWLSVRQTMVQELHQKLIQTLLVPSLAILGQVKDIPAQYRRTKKEPPSKYSFYVPQILKPLHLFVEQWGSFLETQTRTMLLQQCCVRITEMFVQKTETMLQNLKSVEDSLKWLQQQKKKRSEETGSIMSDEDKARLQVFLDIQEFGRELKGMNVVEPDEMEAYRNLLRIGRFPQQEQEQ